ncbi:hypothetical protein PG984_002889 [Apiospora sp. TS-2023a]
MSRHVSFVSPDECHPIEPHDETGGENLPVIATNARSNWLYIIIAASTMVMISVWFVLISSMRPPNEQIAPNVTLSQCGNSSDEAATMGCHFDIMSFSWLPPACYDEHLTHEFETRDDWQWFRDQNGTQPVPKDEVILGKQDVFVSSRYHKLHCTFMWKKLHRAIGEGHIVDSYIGNYDHTVHCEHMLLMEDVDSGALNTRIFRKFPSCVPNTAQTTS